MLSGEPNFFFDAFNYSIFIPVFYLHYFILIPTIIKEPSFKSFLIWYVIFYAITILRKEFTLFVTLEYFAPRGWVDWKGEYKPFISMGNVAISSLWNTVCMLGITLGSRHLRNLNRAEELEQLKTQNELRALKNEIDIDETIHILSQLEQKATLNPSSIQEEIIQLSSVLRYHLYSKEPEAILSKELEIVKNQLELYNELNNGKLQISSRANDKIIKAGVLSKTIGEMVKILEKESPNLEINVTKESIYLKISDESLSLLNMLKQRFDSKFEDQIKIQLINKAIIIKLN